MPTHHVTQGTLVASGAKITVGAPAIQLLERASALLIGMRVLARSEPAAAPAATFLGSWILELLLKAHLARTGKTRKELRQIQHNLVELWKEAAAAGLDIPASPPAWCEQLSATHDHPYVQRYDTDIAAWASPNVDLLLAELTALQAIVRVELS